MNNIIIAMDGPVGAGKSSVACEVARRLGVLHLDTGAMYRACAWKIMEMGISVADEKKVKNALKNFNVQVKFEDGEQKTFVDNQDVSALIRTPEVSMNASVVASQVAVREAMIKKQREIAQKQSVVLDGRDIGTTVLPNADVKFYLTAQAAVRANRRYEEWAVSNEEITYEQVLADVISRDEQDMNRPIDPLKPADDAIVIDSSYMSKEEVVEDMLRRIDYVQGKRVKPAEKMSGIYKFVKCVMAFLFKIIWRVRFHNKERMLLDAPYILISNHGSNFDPLVLMAGSDRYQVNFLAKKELFKYKIFKKGFESAGVIPVDRKSVDMHAIRNCLNVLKEGRILGIFPEGTRHHEGVMEELQNGVAMIALRSKATIMPVYISDKPRAFKSIDVYFGQPIIIEGLDKMTVNRESCTEVTEQIKATYVELIKRHEEKKGKIE